MKIAYKFFTSITTNTVYKIKNATKHSPMSMTLTQHWKWSTDTVREILDVELQPRHILVAKALMIPHKI